MNITEAHAYCASLPGATLDYKWQFQDSVHPVFSVGGRMFAMFSMKGGKLTDTLLFKAHDARFLELTDREGIAPSAYLARAKWVTLDTVKRLADAELKSLLGESHAVVLAKSSKKAQAAILAAATAAPESTVSSKRASSRRATAKKAATTPASKRATRSATRPIVR